MSRTRRKPRPIKRGGDQLRDDRLFIVACDDTYAPDQYFNFFSIPRVQIHVVPTTDGTSHAMHVLDRLMSIEHEADDELWLLLDTDHYTDDQHFSSFIQAIKKAKQQGIRVALSKPCFELWLLLHHVAETEVGDLRDASSVAARLRSVLGAYNKRALRTKDYSISSVVPACKRAARLDKGQEGNDRPEFNTSRIYLLWKSIVEKSIPAQLPPELLPLKSGWEESRGGTR